MRFKIDLDTTKQKAIILNDEDKILGDVFRSVAGNSFIGYFHDGDVKARNDMIRGSTFLSAVQSMITSVIQKSGAL